MLSKQDYKLLKKYKNSNVAIKISQMSEREKYYIRLKYLKNNNDFFSDKENEPVVYTLSEEGKMAVEAYEERLKEIKRERRVENMKYIITTAIAVLALVLSAISLANQLGLISLPKS